MCRYNALCTILLIRAYHAEQALRHIAVFSLPFIPLIPHSDPNTELIQVIDGATIYG